MKRNVLVFGLISGLIVSTFMVVTIALCNPEQMMEGGMLIGYASMLIAFSFVFIGVKNYRDKYNGGVISFGKAFKTGLYITLIASTMYVGVWLIEYYFFLPDFMDKFAEHSIKAIQESGKPAEEIKEKVEEMLTIKEMYKNPIFVILFTYLEILTVGLPVAVICALILRRKMVKADVVGG